MEEEVFLKKVEVDSQRRIIGGGRDQTVLPCHPLVQQISFISIYGFKTSITQLDQLLVKKKVYNETDVYILHFNLNTSATDD